MVTVIVCTTLYWKQVQRQIIICLKWVKGLDLIYGALTLCIANIIGALLFLPCLPFTLGAGFLFGTLVGAAVVSVASTLAAVISFLTSRYLARGFIEKRLGAKGSKFRVLDNAIKKDGFRIVCLVRASPIHPYGVFNYLFGLTSVSLRDYTVASFFAMLPGTIVEVYFGTAIKNVKDLINGSIEQTPEARLFFWGAFVLTIVLTIYVTVWLKRKLANELLVYEEVPAGEELEEVEQGDGDREEEEEEEGVHDLSALHSPSGALSSGTDTDVGEVKTNDSHHHHHHHLIPISPPMSGKDSASIALPGSHSNPVVITSIPATGDQLMERKTRRS